MRHATTAALAAVALIAPAAATAATPPPADALAANFPLATTLASASGAAPEAATPTCEASWYGGDDGFVGRPTASGEPFDDTAMTAAMWDVPLGSTWQVTNATNGAAVTVRINDRGPAHRLERCIDLSRAAFETIAPLGAGLIDVTLTRLD